jgi:vacuolar-type H+-ATPase subunit C/Vma6
MRKGTDNYLITRIHGLRTHLIPSRDIQFLVNSKDVLGVSENLMKSDYSTEIGQLPSQERDAVTLERLFFKTLVDRFFFVRRAAQGKMQNLLERYSARFEVENIKRIIRVKHGRGTEEPSLIPLPRERTLVNLNALAKAGSVDEAVSLLRDTPYHALLKRLQAYKESEATLILEAALDNIYFARVWELVESFRDIRELVGEEVDLRNLLLVLSLKGRETPARTIEEGIIPIYYRLRKTTLHSVLQSRLEDAASVLTTPYSKLVSEAASIIREDSSLPLEWLFFKQLYADAFAFSRTHSLQAGYIVAYLLLCECEARNLVSIITGKQLGLSEEEISKRLFVI